MVKNNIKITLVLIFLVFQISRAGNDFCGEQCNLKTAKQWKEAAKNSIQGSNALMDNIKKRYGANASLLLPETELPSEKQFRIHSFMKNYFQHYGGTFNCECENQTLTRDIRSLDDFEWHLRNYGVICYLKVLDHAIDNETLAFLKTVKDQIEKIKDCKKVWLNSYQIAIFEQCNNQVR